MTVYEEPPKDGRSAEAVVDAGQVQPVIAGLPSAHPSASYWLQNPSPLLLGHRTTPQLPEIVDVIVVGSGITGSFAADALLEDGNRSSSSSKRVLLLEAREACFGATGRNGGHCQPMVYHSAPDVAMFELATFHFLERFVTENSVPCDWRTLPGGGVHAYLDADLFALAEALVETLAVSRPDLAAHVTIVRPVNDKAANTESAETGTDTEADPDTKPTLQSLRLRGAAGALVQRHAASVWPYKLVTWVLERLIAKHSASGAFNLQTNTPVLGIKRDSSSSSSRPDTPLWTVETPRGRVRARAVLLATNGYLSHLLPSDLADLVVPVRGQVAALVPPSGSIKVATSETVKPAAANVKSVSTSSVSSSSDGDSQTRVTVTKTEHGQTTTTVRTTTTSRVPAARLSRSYVFVGHDRGLPASQGDRDEYLVQRPLTAGSGTSGKTQSSSVTASSSSVNEYASASATSSISEPSVPPVSGGHFIWGGGRQRAANTAVGEWRDDAVEPSVARYLRSHLAPVLDVGGEEPPVPLDAQYEWTGIMGFSRDQNPWVGRVPASVLAEERSDYSGGPSGLYVSAGYTGHGMPSAALCGRAVACMVKHDLGWESNTTTEGASGQLSLSIPLGAGGHAKLPQCFLMTAERIRKARATCEPVNDASPRSLSVELQQILAQRKAEIRAETQDAFE
ncbi:hypothetical protein SEPCBS119000_004103 [Sporothrix epigloea]|uniref:FAD dependent oxidoreductase domain-containing protein n=1 Tax=Sporothrix epigloea TaxID=1892477 RepID=A0ABP0DSD5_9PEZI